MKLSNMEVGKQLFHPMVTWSLPSLVGPDMTYNVFSGMLNLVGRSVTSHN